MVTSTFHNKSYNCSAPEHEASLFLSYKYAISNTTAITTTAITTATRNTTATSLLTRKLQSTPVALPEGSFL